MKRRATFFAFICALLIGAATGSKQLAQSPPAAQPGGDKFVYADFESVQDNRPVSSRGGFVQLISYQESTPSKMKGLANVNPPAPELVRLKQDDPNRAAAFDYELHPTSTRASAYRSGGCPTRTASPSPTT